MIEVNEELPGPEFLRFEMHIDNDNTNGAIFAVMVPIIRDQSIIDVDSVKQFDRFESALLACQEFTRVVSSRGYDCTLWLNGDRINENQN